MKLTDGLSLNQSDDIVDAFSSIQRQETQEVPGTAVSRTVPGWRRVFETQALAANVPPGTVDFRGAEGRAGLNEVSVSFGQVMQGFMQSSCGIRESDPSSGLRAMDMMKHNPVCHVPSSMGDRGLSDLPLPATHLHHVNDVPSIVHSMGLTRDLGTCREIHNGGIAKRARKQPQSRYRTLARSQLRPVSEREQGIGPRRRGRPPGSGNRKQMTPQKTGPNGVKQFHMRSNSYTGVYQTPGGRWRAQISHQGRVVQLGMYDDEEASAHRWDLEALRLRGSTTRLNFPHLKTLYLSLIRDAMAGAEDRALDFSAIFDEETIKREIQARTSSTTESARSGLKQEPSESTLGSSSESGMRTVVDTRTTIDLCNQVYIDNPLVTAPRDTIINNRSQDIHSAPRLEKHNAHQARLVVPENSRTTTASLYDNRNSIEMRRFPMNFVCPHSGLKHESRSYIQTDEEIRRETEKLLHRFQDDLDAPLEHGSL